VRVGRGRPRPVLVRKHAVQEVVCRFARRRPLHFISHLDIVRTIERALRRANVPVAYTAGFNPRPRLSFATAIAVGMTSEAELMCLQLAEGMSAEAVQTALNQQLPEGLEVVSAWAVPTYKGKFPLGEVDTAEYDLDVDGFVEPESVEQCIAEFLCQEHHWIKRTSDKRTKELDLRPLVETIKVSECTPERVRLHLVARMSSQGGARPEEVLAVIGLADGQHRSTVHRTALYAKPQPTRAGQR